MLDVMESKLPDEPLKVAAETVHELDAENVIVLATDAGSTVSDVKLFPPSMIVKLLFPDMSRAL
jgi:hypothetical protein